MALDDLIARLERDADARLAALREKTDAEVARLLAEAAAAQGTRERRALDTSRQARRKALDRALVEARQEARAAELRAKRALLDRVIARARALFPEHGLARWKAALGQELDEALRYLEDAVVVRCSADVFPEVKALLAARAGLALAETSLGASGCVLTAADGAVRLDVTFEARLARAAPHLAVTLFAEVPP